MDMGLRSYFKTKLFARRLKKSGLEFPILSKVNGVGSGDRQGALAQSAQGDGLQIVHTPLKKYPHNTYVYSISLNRVLGYLDKELSQKLQYVFGDGFCLDGELCERLGGPPQYDYFGCNICIFDTKTLMKDVDDFAHLRS